MSQYKHRPWKEPPIRLDSLDTPLESKTAAIRSKLKGSNKDALVRAFAWEHPMVTMDLGTLTANVKRAHTPDDLTHEIIISMIRCAVRQASAVKHQSQELLEDPLEKTPEILDLLCPRLFNDLKDNKDGEKSKDTKMKRTCSNSVGTNDHERKDASISVDMDIDGMSDEHD
ncbi:hypothetical protein BGW38_002497, partial [Lunasporangiospora selenospora]